MTFVLMLCASVLPAQDIVYEKSISALAADLASGKVTSVQLVDAYLARIAAYDKQGPALNAMITINPKAREEAARMDRERPSQLYRGPLQGIPVIIKDNYTTAAMPTQAGSIALAGFVAGTNAFQVQKLRMAGAIILGKTNMHDLAMGVTGANSMGGQTCNPYDPDRIPGGSSSGTAAGVAASFAAIGWGSDTCGSIRVPAASNNLFGLRPTKGLTSVAGIVPLSHSQDVAGPLARTVEDLAIGLDATIGADPKDPATRILANQPIISFVQALDTNALRGSRIGVFTDFFGNQPDDREAADIVRAALERMRQAGATLIDVAIPGLDTLMAPAGVIDYEFKHDFEEFLSEYPTAPIRTLQEIIDRRLYDMAIDASINRRNARGSRTSPNYFFSLERRDMTRAAVVRLLDSLKLDGIAYPTARRKPTLIGQGQPPNNCQLSAVTGLPALSMPAGFTPDSLPIGFEILGRTLADTRLVALAFSYEQHVHPRRPPKTTPPLAVPPKR